MKNVPIRIFSCEGMKQEAQNANLVGYTCLEQDVLYRGYSGSIATGDYVAFGNVGGYSNVDKPPFILPQCTMVGINDKEIYVIKRKETTDDILNTYIY